jgi:hypothetical protein
MHSRQWIEASDDALGRLFPKASAAGAAAFALALVYGVALAVFKLLPLNDALAFAALLVAMFLLLARCPGTMRRLLLHAITQVIVLAWVINLWTLGYEGRSAVFGGILPWSDSFGFLNDALRLTHGQLLEMSAKRPIFPTTLAALLRLFGGDLRLALLTLSAFAAFAVAFATNTVWRTHGRRAALVVFAILMLSERHWAGVIQTEDIGLPLGLIGFALIWRATAAADTGPARARWMVLAGLFAITIALMARAGAFFILPALAIWSALHLVPAQSSGSAKLSHLGWAFAAIVGGVVVHEVVLHAAASGMSFSDYPAIVFGLIHHKDFTLLLEMHPELQALTGAARAGAAWQIVIAEALAHPGLLILGMLRSVAELIYTPNGLFGFVWRNPDDMVLESGAAVRAALAQHGVLGPVYLWVAERGLYSLVNALAMAVFALAWVVATLAALVALFRREADRYTTLLRWAIGGVLLSAPFTPPWITQAHQVETATLAFMAVMTATWRLSARPLPNLGATKAIWLPPGFAIAVMLAAVILPALPLQPPDGARTMHLYPSATVRVVGERTLNFADRRDGDLWFSVQYLKKHNRDFTAALTPYLKAGTVYVLGFDVRDGNAKILIDDGGKLDLSTRWQAVTATPQTEPAVEHVTIAGR